MKLHANAPLGPKGRAIMVRRVLEEGIALTGGGRGRRSEREDRRQMGAPLPRRRGGRAARSQLGPEARPQRHTAERVEAITALRRVRLTGPEIAETLEMATSTVSAVLKRIGLGSSPAWSRWSRSAAMSAPGPAS